MNFEYTNKMWADIFEEMENKGDAFLDLIDSVCIVRLRQVVQWTTEEITIIEKRAEITEAMSADHAELTADLHAAKRLLEYFGATLQEDKDNA